MARPIGTCKLTGEIGPLVKAHILPKALTYPVAKGRPFAQAGHNCPPIKRWDSWYDQSIVTQGGEDILTDFDTHAIEGLRNQKLVWSSWGTGNQLPVDYTSIPGTNGWGIRQVQFERPDRVRLFFLSLLWRAAVSRLSEFSDVCLRASELRRLSRMLRCRDARPLHRYPVALIQLSSRGGVHNLTPIFQRKPITPWLKNGPSYPIVRFYSDGLIAHVHRDEKAGYNAELGDMFIGNSENTTVSVVPFEGSWQQGNLKELTDEAEARWPERLRKIPGFEG